MKVFKMADNALPIYDRLVKFSLKMQQENLTTFIPKRGFHT
jgi:hypothetical protein